MGTWFTIDTMLEVPCLSYVIDIEVISVVLHACQNSRYLGAAARFDASGARARAPLRHKEPWNWL